VVAEPQQRRVTLEAAAKLTAYFSLPTAPDHADWDILCTFGSRTEEFLTHYATCASLTADDKFALMTMIISSFDDRLGKDGDPNQLAARCASCSWPISRSTSQRFTTGAFGICRPKLARI